MPERSHQPPQTQPRAHSTNEATQCPHTHTEPEIWTLNNLKNYIHTHTHTHTHSLQQTDIKGDTLAVYHFQKLVKHVI